MCVKKEGSWGRERGGGCAYKRQCIIKECVCVQMAVHNKRECVCVCTNVNAL